MSSFLNELLKLKSYDAISGVLNNVTLKGLQCVDVLKMLARQRSMLIYGTGMGKTLMACACIRLLLNENPRRRFIFFVTSKQLAQTPQNVVDYLGIAPIICTGEEDSIRYCLLSGRYKDHSIIMLTHSVLQSPLALNFLRDIKKDIDCVIIDEAHKLNNFSGGLGAGALAALCNEIDYVFALTATPITTGKVQLCDLAHVVDPITYPNARQLELDVRKGRFMLESDPCFFISRERGEFNVKSRIIGDVVWVQAMEHQLGLAPIDVCRACKGNGAINQAMALVNFIKERKGKRGLIYVREHATREWLLPFLDAENFSYDCVNGRTNNKHTVDVMRRFNEEKSLDIIITSTEESLNLDCDWVLLYEFTVNVQQIIGRAYRGYDDKTLYVYFMITRNSGEENYFFRNIYLRAVEVQQVLGKYYSAIYDANRKLGLD